MGSRKHAYGHRFQLKGRSAGEIAKQLGDAARCLAIIPEVETDPQTGGIHLVIHPRAPQPPSGRSPWTLGHILLRPHPSRVDVTCWTDDDRPGDLPAVLDHLALHHGPWTPDEHNLLLDARDRLHPTQERLPLWCTFRPETSPEGAAQALREYIEQRYGERFSTSVVGGVHILTTAIGTWAWSVDGASFAPPGGPVQFSIQARRPPAHDQGPSVEVALYADPQNPGREAEALRDAMRRWWVDVESTPVDSDLAVDEEPEQALEAVQPREREEDSEAALLARVSNERHREVVRLRRQGLSHKEIAEIVGYSNKQSVKNVLSALRHEFGVEVVPYRNREESPLSK